MAPSPKEKSLKTGYHSHKITNLHLEIHDQVVIQDVEAQSGAIKVPHKDLGWFLLILECELLMGTINTWEPKGLVKVPW